MCQERIYSALATILPSTYTHLLSPGTSSFEGALLVHIVPQPPTRTCTVSPPLMCGQLWPFRGCNLWPWVQRFGALTTRLQDQWRLSQLYLPAIDTTVSLKYAHTLPQALYITWVLGIQVQQWNIWKPPCVLCPSPVGRISEGNKDRQKRKKIKEWKMRGMKERELLG